MIPRLERPYNAEPPKELLLKHFNTPNSLFYVRNHGDVPTLEQGDYSIEIRGLVQNTITLKMDDFVGEGSSFTPVTIPVTLQCAGNRRSEVNSFAKVASKVLYEQQAIGNALWTGIPLRAVLNKAGVLPEAQHVEFIGDDSPGQGPERFFTQSIPIEKAMSKEVLLAYQMNGEPLPPIHGYPLRVIVPGYIAAKSVKWLKSIVLREDPSPSPHQQKNYKLFPPMIMGDWAHPVDWSKGLPLGETSVNSAILSPNDGETITHGGYIEVAGWAYAGGNRTVERIDISVDGGSTWVACAEAYLGEQTRWSWTLWRALVPVYYEGPLALACRAWDNATNTQPEEVSSIWNWKGYANNALHKIHILSVIKKENYSNFSDSLSFYH